MSEGLSRFSGLRAAGRAAGPVARRFRGLVIDRTPSIHVQRFIAVADRAATADQDLRAGARLALLRVTSTPAARA